MRARDIKIYKEADATTYAKEITTKFMKSPTSFSIETTQMLFRN